MQALNRGGARAPLVRASRIAFALLGAAALLAADPLPAPAAPPPDPASIAGAVRELRSDQVLLDVGSNAGVALHMVFDVYRPARLVRLPLTDAVAYAPHQLVSRLVVVDVERDYSRARTIPLDGGAEGQQPRAGDLVYRNPLVTPANVAPFVRNTRLSSERAAFGQPITVRLEVTNESTDRIYYRWTCTDGVLQYQTTSLPENTWSPCETRGPQQVRVTITDSAGGRVEHPIPVESLGMVGDAPRQYRFQRHLASQAAFFLHATDIAFDERNAAYILDAYNRRIAVFASDWQRTAETEVYSSDYEFERLLVSNGEFYLLDRETQNVKKFRYGPRMFQSPPAVTYGSLGTNNGQFTNPVDIALGPGGDLYVLDQARGAVSVFTSAGQFVYSFGALGEGAGRLQRATALDVALDGKVYVLDDGRKRVLVFDDARLVGEYEAGESAERLTDIKLDPFSNLMIVLDAAGGYLKPLDRTTGRAAARFAGSGERVDQLNEPTRIRVDSAQNVYVTDTEGESIVRYAVGGQFRGRLGGVSLARSGKIAVGPRGDLAMLDLSSALITRLSPEGFVMARFGGFGEVARGQFDEPIDITVDAEGNCYVLDTDRGTVVKFAPDGQRPSHFGEPGEGRTQLYDAIDIECFAGTVGRVAVLQERDNYNIAQFDLSGRHVASIPLAEGEIEDPLQIAFDRAGWAFVVNDEGAVLAYDNNPGRRRGSYDKSLDEATDATASNLGQVIVVDSGNAVVRIYTGENLQAAGSISDERNCARPADVAADAYGRIYVFDSGEGRVAVFGP